MTGLLRWCSGWLGDWLDKCQSDWLDDAMAQPARDRVTVDLRGLGDRVRSHAGAQQLSTGAFVRRAVLSQLKVGDLATATELAEPAGPVVKVTLRLSDHHAALLARRARHADVSQGAYVAGLIKCCGELRRGKEVLHDLVEQWGYGGMPIDELGHRREAFNIMLSMPHGNDAQVVWWRHASSHATSFAGTAT